MKKINLPNLREWFFKLPIFHQILHWSKRFAPPGFAHVSIYDVIVFVLNETKKYDLITRANSTAYSFFLSLFPALIALFTLIPILKSYFILYLPGGEGFDELLRQEILHLMPGIAGERLFDFIEEITNETRLGLLSFGFILSIYFASNGMIALMKGFEKSDLQEFKSRHFLKKRLIAIVLTFQMGILLIASVIFVILGQTILDFITQFIPLDFFTKFLINLIRWISIISLFYFGIAIIYRHGAPVKKKFNLFSPGATLATILSLITSVSFSYYIDQIKTENQLYGTIWTIIVIMLWIQLNSMVLLIGFELNTSIAVNKSMRHEASEANEEASDI